MINRLVQNFIFDEKIRNDLVFSDVDKIRLNTEGSNNFIQLKVDSEGFFPLDANLFIETPFITPNALKKWLLFEPIFETTKGTLDLPAGVSLGFKIKTTAGNFFWDGGAWVAAGLGDWNTEADIRININTFPIATIGNKSIGFVVNLVTTDKNLTPKVEELKILGNFDIEYFEDLVYDGIVRLLNTSFRTSSELEFFDDSSSTSSIDLDSVLENKGYNITGIRSVYDITDDPLKLVDLFDSYAPGAIRQDGFTFDPGIVTLNAAVPTSNSIIVTFEYVPEIMVKTHQDYFEAPSYPAIVFESIAEIARRGFIMQDTNSYGDDFVRDKENDSAVQQLSPTQKSYRFEYASFTSLQIDQMRLIKDLNAFFSRNKQLTMWGLGIKRDLDVVEEIDTSRNKFTDGSDRNIGVGSFDVLGVLSYDKISIDVPLVQNNDNIILKTV